MRNVRRVTARRTTTTVRAAISDPEWQRRAAERACAEIVQAGTKVGLPAADVVRGCEVFQSLLPGVIPNLDAMRASDWAAVVYDCDMTAAKLVLLKAHYPRLNLRNTILRHPRVLKLSYEQLDANAIQVKQLLESAPEVEVILDALPELLDPRVVFSVIVTLRKWYPKEPDPVAVLQKDPDIIRCAQNYDVPLEPVYDDAATGRLVAGSFSKERRQPWQNYIDEVVYKQKPLEHKQTDLS